MAQAKRFVSFLDRFEEQLVVDCESLKRELVDKVDRQFGVIRAKVHELKNQFGGCGGGVLARSRHVDHLPGDPEVVNITLEEWQYEQRATDAVEQQRNTPAIGQKRASHSGPVPSKKRKPNPSNTNQTKKFVCKYEGCGQSFDFVSYLRRHECIHSGIKPFSCAWNNCTYSAALRTNVVVHIRTTHFKLPNSQKEQQRLNIVDERDPNDYVQVDTQMAQHRPM